MSEGVWVLVVVLVAATGFGLFRAARDGRFRGTHVIRPRLVEPVETTAPAGAGPVEPSVLDGTDLEHELGERATLLQFSSAFCAPCRATRRVLADVASLVPGVEHVEIDAEHHLDLVRRLGVLRTPTTLVLDHSGREVSRAAGAPTKDAVLATLARVVAPDAT
jgi:thiol-disulfide isomerase/thioredoxin